jgi:simple sugar transport system substrate-binding protein
MNPPFRLPRFVLVCVIAGLLLPSLPPIEAADKTKIGFLYVGPITDYGWTHSQELGRLYLEKNLPWVQTSYVESVTDGDIPSYVDQMADQGVKIIFLTSAGFADGAVAVAAQHPDIIFFHVNGYRRAPNLATYAADTYQGGYLEGLLAGALTKTGKIGCVSTSPESSVARATNAFALGVQASNPKATVIVRWLNTYYDPPATKEATETLLSQGVDFLVSGMDSPTVQQVAETRKIPTIGKCDYMADSAPNTLVTGEIYQWGQAYASILEKIHNGTYTNKNLQNTDLWLRLAEKAIVLGYKPGVLLNPAFQDRCKALLVSDGRGGKISVYDLFQKRLAEMSQPVPTFEPFTGPLSDASGKPRISAGRTATQEEMYSMTWRVSGILGNWPAK